MSSSNMFNNHLEQTPTPILLSVVGGAPQVITETLYGIYKNKDLMPEQIFVITTTFGKEKIKRANIQRHIDQFRQNYNIDTTIELRDENIWVIVDQNNQPLVDAHTQSQHQAMADFIIEKVRMLSQATVSTDLIAIKDIPNISNEDSKSALKQIIATQMKHIPSYRDVKALTKKKKNYLAYQFDRYQIHASIAGGRKSMTFLLGYAMSLFARPSDKVSHVLVDERIENCPEFFYPSVSQDIRKIGKSAVSVDFNQVNVSLAYMPLVLMSNNMPKVLLEQQRGYSETVALFESFNKPLSIEIDLTPIRYQDSNKIEFEVKLSEHKVTLDIEQVTYLWAWTQIEGLWATAKDEDNFTMLLINCYATLLTGNRQQLKNKVDAVLFFSNLEYNALYRNEYLLGKDMELDEAKIKVEKNGQLTGAGGLFGGCLLSKYRNNLIKALTPVFGSEHAEKYAPQKTYNKNVGANYYVLPVSKNHIVVLP
jgi:hypothetical protein